MLEAILFDLDDTLIDWGHFFDNWEQIEAHNLRRVYDYLGTLGKLEGDFKLYKTEYIRRVRQAWTDARYSLVAPHMGRELVAAGVAMGLPEAIISQQSCLDVYEWGKVPGTEVFPDVIDGLKHLREKGVRLGMITNAFQPMALRDIELEQHGLLEFFPECRFSAADVGHLKPHPAIFRQATDCLAVNPQNVVFVGDNPTADVAGAQNVGMRGVLRVNQKVKPMISGIVVPDGAINEMKELFTLLDEWFPGWGS